jgi:glycerate kinase
MKAVIATDSFKGCLSSAEAAAAVAEGLKGHDCVVLPVSDGGEGFAEVLTAALGGRMINAPVHDPLGRPVEASYGLFGTTAVIESAAASGLTLMRQDELDPLRASSRGTGELIADAIRRGARDIYVGFGGTGTNDGGEGMLEALEPIRELWPECRFTALCDVTATFCGPDGATVVYGPQKGVTPDLAGPLDARLSTLAERYRSVLGRDVLTQPGSGAAGGMAGALWAVLGAELKSGADAILDILHFEDRLDGASLVITGEGHLDPQTLQGKLPAAVALRAKAYSPALRVIAFTGRNDLETRQNLFDDIIQITPPDTPPDVALNPSFARRMLSRAAATLSYSIP